MITPPVFAVQDALDRVDQDIELLKDLIQIFFREYDKNLRELDAALSGGDSIVYKRVAHSLKGAAANVGAMIVSQAAAGMEALDGAGQRKDGKRLLQDLAQAVEDFRKEQGTQIARLMHKA